MDKNQQIPGLAKETVKQHAEIVARLDKEIKQEIKKVKQKKPKKIKSLE